MPPPSRQGRLAEENGQGNGAPPSAVPEPPGSLDRAEFPYARTANTGRSNVTLPDKASPFRGRRVKPMALAASRKLCYYGITPKDKARLRQNRASSISLA